MLSEKKIYNQYSLLKSNAWKLCKENKMELALDCVKTACVLAKQYYLCFTDASLEKIVREIGEHCLPRTIVVGKSGRYLFYDTHTTDNIALTQQYLGALVSWGVDFLYITTKKMDRPGANLIRLLIDSSPHGQYVEVLEHSNYLETANSIVQIVREFQPEKTFIQTTSDDVSGILAWNTIEGIERYYIDLSDHSFWLGVSAADYYITFRSYGYNICCLHRGIDKDKVLVQPFYPVTKAASFQGIPEVSRDSVKILSGGRLDKIYGKGDTYFDLVASVLKENSNSEFFFAGGGAFGKLGRSRYIEKQVEKYGIADRFHLLGFRKDIVELMQKMDIYMGTYPMGGGLMTQLAVREGVPIVQYVSEGLSNSVGEFVDCCDRNQSFVFDNKTDFLEEAKKLINDKVYRRERGTEIQSKILSASRFDTELYQLLFNKNSQYKVSEYFVDLSQVRKNQIEIENDVTHDFPRIIVKSRYMRKKQPLKYLKNVLAFLWYSDKKWLLTKLRGKY